MKNLFKFIFIYVSIITLLFSTPLNIEAKYTTYSYAQIKNDGVYLYKTNSSLSLTNAYFEIPSSYFVLLLSDLDEIFYKAQYKDIVGFVKKSDVTPVAETPQNPYLSNITFRVYATNGTSIMSSPINTKSATVVGKVELLDDIEYYGKIVGDEYVDGRGYEWYYSKYTSNQTELCGYLYKGFCDDLSTITPNTENVTAIANPFDNQDNSYLYNLVDLSTGTKILLILAVCLPCLFLVYLLFKPFKIESLILQTKKVKTKTQAINKIQKIIDDEPL